MAIRIVGWRAAHRPAKAAHRHGAPAATRRPKARREEDWYDVWYPELAPSRHVRWADSTSEESRVAHVSREMRSRRGADDRAAGRAVTAAISRSDAIAG